MKTRKAKRTPVAAEPKIEVKKICSWCRGAMPLRMFPKRTNIRRGYYSYCKVCADDTERKALTAKHGRPDKARMALVAQGKKVCSHCRKVLPLDNFYRNRRASDGCYSSCKTCHGAKVKGYHLDTLTCRACKETMLDKCQMDVDHMNGDHYDNRSDNLCPLCSNCHRLKTVRPSRFYRRYPHIPDTR